MKLMLVLEQPSREEDFPKKGNAERGLVLGGRSDLLCGQRGTCRKGNLFTWLLEE